MLLPQGEEVNSRTLKSIARKIIEYVEAGIPAKDATETTIYSQEEVIYELSKHHVTGVK
jgi:hypothetical protein